MARALFALILMSFTFHAAAQAQQKQVASCEHNGFSYEFFEDPNAFFPAFPHIFIEVSPKGEKRMLSARVEIANGAIKSVNLPGLWPVTSIPVEKCRLPNPLLAKKPKLRGLFDFVRMNDVEVYFIPDGIDISSTQTKLPELIQNCTVIPVKVDLVCETGGSGPMGCASIEILNEKIEVTPQPGC